MSLHEIPSLNFTPDSNIHLLSGVPLTRDYQHTRLFRSSEEQTAYFLSKSTRNIPNGTYVRKDHVIRFDVNAELLFDVNYLMFQNGNYASKWFYAFVTDVEYKNPNTTFIHFEIDVMQTWRFKYSIKPSYVEREHTKLKDGTQPIINTVDEGLDYGSAYDTVRRLKVEQVPDMIFAIITAKVNLGAGKDSDTYYLGSHYGMPSTLNHYIVPIPLNHVKDGRLARMYYKDESITDLQSIYVGLAKTPELQDMVVGIAFTPFIPFDISYKTSSDGGLDLITSDFDLASVEGLRLMKPKAYQKSKIHEILVTENKYYGVTHYKETKLMMYPYTLMEITDEKGEKIEIPLESIKGTSPNEIRLKIASSVSNLPKYAVWVKGLDSTLNDNEPQEMEKALVSKDIQDVPIISDYTATYMQGNRNSYNQGIINTAIGTATNLASSAMMANPYMAVSTLSSGLTSVLSTQAKLKDINNRPPSIANLGKNANFDISNRNNGVWVTTKTIKPEYRKKLESFFGMFGYKINEVKAPELYTRKSWNYIKTNNVTITGNIIQRDLDKIKKIFDNGITFWHVDDVGNYSLNNDPV